MINIKESVINKLKIHQDNYDLNLQLGMIYVNEKNYINARTIFKKLTQLKSDRFEGFLNLSNIFEILKKPNVSEKILKKYLKKNNYNINIINALGSIYYNNKNYKKLELLINQYLDYENNHILFFLKSTLFEIKNDIEQQILYLNKSINVNKNYWIAYEKLFNIYERTNKIKEFEKLINIFPKHNIKLNYYEALCIYRKNEFTKALEKINKNNLVNEFSKLNNLNYLSNLYDLLSKINLKLNNYSLSLKFAIKRNASNLKASKNKANDKKVLLDIIKKYKFFYQYNKTINLKSSNKGMLHKNLVFLVGFPRSGTTLLDTILRTHSKTLVLEEQPYLINIRHKFFQKNSLEKISSISEAEVFNLQKKYFDSFNYSEQKLIIDKFPLNLIELGFIKKIFPQSSIILALRHPLDSILSCVLTYFKINEAMANYENLESAAFFYNEVFSLFTIYKKSFNFDYHLIKYENVVQDFDKEINNLLNYLNLNFEDNIRNFHLTAKNRNKINTPSYHQVIRPLYNDSINRYKNFPEMDKINLLISRWIDEFNY
jgi:hypothetical protein